MKTKTFLLSLIFLFAGWVNMSNMQAQVLVGDTEFWFAAPDLDESSICGPGDSPMMLLITNGSAQPANVSITMYNNGSPVIENKTVAPNGSWKYDIPTANRGRIENPRGSAGNATTYGVHITSDVKVTAYYQILPPCSQDIFALKGTAALGKLFYVPMIHDSYFYTGASSGYPYAYDQIDIVATEDNTTVHVTPTQEIRIGASGSSPAGTEIIRTLNKGQTLKIMEHATQRSAGSPSLGGTHIITDKPVAVTTTEDLIGRSGFGGWDVVGDQIVPTSSLGKRYVVIKGFNSAPERVYMIAAENGTTISVNNGTTTSSSGVLNAGDRWVFDMGDVSVDPQVITVWADKPFYCYQVTGMGNNEMGTALLPSIYSVSQTQLAFYSYEVIQADYNRLLLLFRTGSEGDFTLSYGSTTITPSLTPLPVPGMPEWKAAKYEVPDAARNQVVTIKNTSSMFGMGCFSMSTSSGGASFGYLSAFGTLDFPETMYKCKGTSVTLDAGYGETYIWTLPDGTTLNTSTIAAADTGTYSVVVYQDPFTVTASTRILNRLDGVSLVSSGGVGMGAGTYTYSVDLNGQATDHIGYIWRVDGVEVLRKADSWTTVWANADEHLITVEVSDTALKCTETLRHVHYKLPDNISDAQCFSDPPATRWDIEKKYQSPLTAETRVQAYAQPFAGDLTGDGIPEIVTMNHPTTGDPRHSNAILIFKSDLTLLKSIPVPTSQTYVTLPLALANIDNAGNAEIIYGTGYTGLAAEDIYRLKAYRADGTPVWTSNDTYFAAYTSARLHSCAISVADLDGDGLVEIFCGERIFAGESGALLATLPAGGRGMHYNASSTYENGYLPAIGDVDGDGIQEIVCGNTTYRVTINSRTTPASNSVAVVGTINMVDGYTSVADIDRDGILDVVVVGRADNGNDSQLYVWQGTGTANNQIGNTITGSSHAFSSGDPNYVSGQGRNGSRPFIGDIDGDGWADIAYTSYCLFGAFKYMPATNTFQILFRVKTTDTSAATTMSMFDFNLDNEVELVYRDESHLRIIDKNGNNLASFSCLSGTHTEYPIIVDLNDDGHAEIVVSGRDNSDGSPFGGGTNDHIRLMVFGSVTPNQWVNARSVWNQHAYNATNINEDLSVPRYPVNNAIALPGKNGVPGDIDDVRPFNNFLQQQTPRNFEGNPLWLVPAAKVDSTFYFYDAAKDSMFVTVDIINTGDAPFQTPFHITVYKNAVGNAVKHTYASPHLIQAKDTARITFGISGYFAVWSDADRLVIRANDSGNAFNDQEVCDSLSRDKSDGPMLLALNDYASTITELPVFVSVLANDSIPDGCTPTLEVLTPATPHGGSAALSGDSILYTSAPDFAGHDTVVYRITCKTYTSVAYIYVYASETPDNISEADCYVTPPAQAWDIRPAFTGAQVLQSCVAPVIGDLDGDDIPEIVALNIVAGSNGYISDVIYVYYGDDRDHPQQIPVNDINGNTQTINLNQIGAIAIAKVDLNNNGIFKAIIIVSCDDYKLRAYDPSKPAGSELVWESDETFTDLTSGNVYTSAHIADFNNDGHPEVYSSNRIFDAATGKLLVRGNASDNKGYTLLLYGTNNHHFHFTHAADVYGDKRLELLAGSQVFDIAITNRNGTSGNTMTPIRSFPGVTNDGITFKDGYTFAVDINKDGRLDIVCVSNITKHITLFAWDVEKQELLASMTYKDDVAGYSNTGQSGIPFVGNIDDNDNLEVMLMTTHRLHVFDINLAAKSFDQRTQYTIQDVSGCTGITLFDFNQDGIAELIYRDETQLRILNVTSSGLETRYSLAPFRSATSWEYPVVADVDNDGHAEIVAIGIPNNTGNILSPGSLCILKSATEGAWAPARKVWNQYAYNAVNINEDLTVPAVQINPATVFPGVDGILGTSDDVRPYNNFLQQQTALNAKGTPLWLTPDAKFTATPVVTYYGDGDSLIIAAELTNIGDATLTASFYISAYKDDATLPAHKMATDSSMIALNVGDIMATTVTIRNYSSYAPLTKIIVRINDKGEAKYVQQECDYLNNVYDYAAAGLPKAANDTVATLINMEVTKDVKFNDTIPVACPSPVPAIVLQPTKGNASFVGDQVKYTPQTGFYGVDSLVYRLTCTTGKTEAKMYIVVNKPTAPTYIGCPGKDVTAGFTTVADADVKYLWYTVETGGSPNGGIMDTRSCKAPCEWWVEAQYKGKPVAPRFKITVNAYPELTAGSIKNNDTICYNTVPQPFDNVTSATGGNGEIKYQWQYSEDNGGQWKDITGAISDNYIPANALTQTTWYRREATNECGTVHTDSVEVTVYPQSLYNYPDLRIRVCPDAGTVVNLSKYIDTFAVTSLQWKNVSPTVTISNPKAGTISMDDLNIHTNTYTFTYTVGNPCISDVERKVYVERLNPDRMRPFHDTVVVCHKFAERLQLNQILGIDAAGTWEYHAMQIGNVETNIDGYVTESTSPTYGGAVIMNGKAIYEDSAIDYREYHGNNQVKTVNVIYKTGNSSCLHGKEYTVTIILTQNIMN